MSSNSTIRQVPINNTIQVVVGPGNVTGLYYILVSNLPWQTSWKQVKDHVRTVCSSVERVEIFNESTSGWVCVRGRENFRAAMRHLGSTPFQDRPMFIDGRNAKEEIPIKRLVGGPERLPASPRSPRTPRTAPQLMHMPLDTPPLMSPTASGYDQWSTPSTVSLVSSPVNYGMQPMHTTMAGDYQETTSWYQSHDSSYMGNPPIVSPGQVPTYHAEPLYHVPRPRDMYENHYSISAEPVQLQTLAAPAVIETEYRKIIIRGLSKRTQSDQIKSLLRSKCGLGGNEINSIKIPRSREGGNRGHATITFVNMNCAERAVQRLHHYNFDGHQLEVRLTNEGVSPNEERRARPQRQQEASPQQQQVTGSQSTSSAQGKRKGEESINTGVIIANGSSSRPTSQSSEPRSQR